MTSDQLESFRKEGYLRIEQPFSADVLSFWRKKTEILETTLKPETAINTFFSSTEEVGRVNDLMRYFPEDAISFLASDPIMEIAHDVCGKHAVPLSCDLLIKRNGTSSMFNWHQDVVHSRDFPFIVIGIYLDDSNLYDGQLSIIKGSHFAKQNIAEANKSTALDIPAKAGDIIVHDAMVLHRSESKAFPGKRRTIYVEMRPYEAIVADGFQSQKWADLRREWMGFVLNKANTTWQNKFNQSHNTPSTNFDQFVPELLNEFSQYPPAHYG